MPRITNRQIPDFVSRTAPFRANSTEGAWLDWTSGGYLPDEWRLALARDLGRASDHGFTTYVVTSYATPIAWWTLEGGWVIPKVRYSVTTSKAQGFVRRAVGEYRETLPVSV